MPLYQTLSFILSLRFVFDFFFLSDPMCFLCTSRISQAWIMSRMRIKMVAHTVGTAHAQLRKSELVFVDSSRM